MKITTFILEEGARYIGDADENDARRYFEQYNTLIKFAKGIEKTDLVSIDILALAVYAWMPTILKTLKIDALAHLNGVSIEDLRSATIQDGLSKFSSYTQAGAPINNSWIGTSKFLHFLNPSVFPIWDSKICWTVKKTNSPNSRNLYREYFDAVHATIVDFRSELANIRSSLNLKNNEITDVRLVEMCLFAYADKNKPKRETKN